ncbi:MAG: 16S rRNA (adenine(1518)-N(6)/adenine(1519)-N(6))-dimethyltransferase RsmA [Candidatus Marinimicrobia bacterium]|nr:16S rRNA (adenine(1518)-N(6)/adenine(1519)-N(6))-dimethyltransferase RsmA [Candidatus Neomarinimicrobiota bacterium]
MKHFAKKKWGQNFLIDPNLLRKIIRTIGINRKDNVLEIGPGEGVLTERILPIVNGLAVIEIDPILVEHLRMLESIKGCQIIHGDVLWLELKTLPINKPVKVVGNIPYNITSPILFWLIEQREDWSEAYLMVQKEVATRLTGQVGTKSYGRLTVMTGAFLDIEKCFNIPPEVFVPRPKVDSAFIKITKKVNPIINDEQFDKFEILVKAAFSKRRKMLQNSLSGFDISQSVKDKINFTRRPETLSIAEFAELI